MQRSTMGRRSSFLHLRRATAGWILAGAGVVAANALAQTPAPGVPSGAQSAQNAAQPAQPTAQPAPAAPCAAAEARQFDFWVGDWALTWKQPDGSIGQGSNRVETVFGGCVIQENFEGRGPQALLGRSWSVWSPRARKWQQTWVDNSGGYLDLTGEFADGRMVLVRDGILGNGKPGKQRMVFYNITRDEFDWDWETSEDAGQSWVNRWRIHYKRK